MKLRLIKYLSFALFSCISVASFNVQCMDKQINSGKELLVASLVTGSALRLVINTGSWIANKVKSGSEAVGISNSNQNRDSSTIPPRDMLSSVYSYPISEKISEFGKKQYESISNFSRDCIDAFTSSSPVKLSMLAWNHKGKIALTVAALALYKKYNENKKTKGIIKITNQPGGRIVINKA